MNLSKQKKLIDKYNKYVNWKKIQMGAIKEEPLEKPIKKDIKGNLFANPHIKNLYKKLQAVTNIQTVNENAGNEVSVQKDYVVRSLPNACEKSNIFIYICTL